MTIPQKPRMAMSPSSTARPSTAGTSAPRPATAAPARTRPAASGSAVDGAIVGSQDIPGNGGIIITDKEYGDFEVALEMKNDFGPDSGLFLRSTDKGKRYQAMIDYHAGGNLMGIYGEGLGGKPHVRNFDLHGQGHRDQGATSAAVPAARSSPEDWPKFWKHGEWNELRARIDGQPAEASRPGSRA